MCASHGQKRTVPDGLTPLEQRQLAKLESYDERQLAKLEPEMIEVYRRLMLRFAQTWAGGAGDQPSSPPAPSANP
jgi:hypothetical protein